MIFQSDQQTYYGPVPWWVLTGTLTCDEIVRQLDEFSLRNIKEVFLYANYGLEKPDFLSEEAKKFAAVLNENPQHIDELAKLAGLSTKRRND